MAGAAEEINKAITEKHERIYFNPDVGFTPSDIASILAQNTK